MAKSAKESDDDIEESIETDPLVIGKTGQDGILPVVRELVPFKKTLLPTEWLLTLERCFGYKLLTMLFVSQHLMKGFAGSFTGPATQFLYRSYNVTGPRMQIFGGVTFLPWAMKPIIGLVSDCLPIRGYNKAPYILLTSVFGGLACLMLGGLPPTVLTIERAVACLFLLQLQFSTCDLLTEAKYAEKMQANPDRGPDLMTFVWFGLMAGGLLATIFVGPMLTAFGPKAIYKIALVPVVIILVPVAKNFLEEARQSAEQVAEARHRLASQKEACALCVLMFAGTVTLTVLGILYESIYVNAIVSILLAVIMLVAFSLVLRPVIAKVNAFFLVQTSLGFSVGGASFYFFTDTPEQYPEGPHFSMAFFTSVLGIVGSVFSLVGIYSYQRYMKDWTYQKLLLMTNITLSLLNMSDVIILSRTNIRLGIPDRAFVLGASALQMVVGQWMWMPGVVILSQLCPKGMEATMYALLAGCHNLGNTIAGNLGALVLLWLNCSPNGQPHESKQFDNLWKGSALSTVLPMLTLLVLPWLIPNARQTDKLLPDEDRDATTGSLLRRLRGQT